MLSFSRYPSGWFNVSLSRAISFIWFSIIIFSLLSCNEDDSFENSLVSEIDIVAMGKLNVPDFYLFDEGPFDSIQTQYVFVRDYDSTYFHIRVGIYESRDSAKDFTDWYLSVISAVMHEGPYQGVTIGDYFWWLGYGDDISYTITNIIFIRNNAYISLSSHDYLDIMTLATKIDNDIITGETYIKYRN